ncbi:hypothetical protein ACFWA9_10035 [Kitasatospora sp. NPDC059973]|uniref:hypothetical protein n=1 Tax=Kitasatospora sp. NPDC059973 TaxID=3347020 RepID=UPI0036C70B47
MTTQPGTPPAAVASGEQPLDSFTAKVWRHDFTSIEYELTEAHIPRPFVELPVELAPAGTVARFTRAHLALLWHLHVAVLAGDANTMDKIRVESADGEALVVRVGVSELRFALVLLGNSRQLCTAAGCMGDAIGGSRYLSVCRDHLDAEGPEASVFNGPTEQDRRDRFRLRAKAWRGLIDDRRGELTADAKRLAAAGRREPSGY